MEILGDVLKLTDTSISEYLQTASGQSFTSILTSGISMLGISYKHFECLDLICSVEIGNMDSSDESGLAFRVQSEGTLDDKQMIIINDSIKDRPKDPSKDPFKDPFTQILPETIVKITTTVCIFVPTIALLEDGIGNLVNAYVIQHISWDCGIYTINAPFRVERRMIIEAISEYSAVPASEI